MSIAADEHKNDPKVWRLADGQTVSTWSLRNMFMGKIPNKAQRKLLGITKV